ncbi:MAG: PhoH family protein, partial [candidate division Zixibacteria bacterium]|nr:PhoH family protein [candidate division Zixibacteria bacterium]
VNRHDIVFAIGPAGTGKTYLAVAMAVAELKAKRVNRVVFTRPAVEAGESLGFLPGDIRAKVDPYLRPVYDALYDMLQPDKTRKLLEMGVIEIAPLAFMRGRTLNEAFVVLDEAQNTTNAQMKMFLTRIGEKSKAVITGDITQIDLDKPQASGLVKVQKILRGINGIEFIYLTERDVIRHRLVQDIIRAYGKYEKSRKKE